MTFAMSFGRYKGFYIYFGYTKRICLGWVSLDVYPFEVDDFMAKKLGHKGVRR